MKLYTFDELKADLQQFENVEVSFSDAPELRLLALYSDFYDTATSNDSTVEELKERIAVYLHEVTLPSRDIDPTEEHKFYLYQLIVAELGRSTPHDAYLKFFGAADDLEALKLLAANPELQNQFLTVVDVSAKRLWRGTTEPQAGTTSHRDTSAYAH